MTARTRTISANFFCFLTAGLACLAIACLTPNPARAEMYMYIDDKGGYHFTDSPKSADYIPTPHLEAPQPPVQAGTRYTEIIKSIASTYGVRPELVQAVIRVESGFNPTAVSRAGARGLMQIMPVHIQKHRISDPFDPRQNITAGTRYLSDLLKRYNGDLNLSLAAYNAGPSRVDHYKGIPPYPETRQYVQKVLSCYKQYRRVEK